MPGKYSHGLIFSQQHYWDIINTHRPPSLKPPSSRSSTSRTHSTASSIPSPSNDSAQKSVYSHYIRLEPDPEPEPPHDYRTFTYIRRPSSESTPSNALRFESTPSERSYPPLDRLRLEDLPGPRKEKSPSPPPELESQHERTPSYRPSLESSDRLRLEDLFGSRTQKSPSPPPEVEPKFSKRPQHGRTPPYRPDSESSERLRLGPPFPFSSRDPRPSLHHKSSSVETQIYAPNPTISPPPTRERQDLFSAEAHELCPSSPPTHERQHVFSMESPESSSPSLSTGDRHERFSSETQSPYLSSPTRDRQQNFVQETQALASPLAKRGRQIHSLFGTQNSPLFPSAQELQDYFSIETQGSQSTPAATGDRQGVSSLKARSAKPTAPHDGGARPSLEIQRLQSPPQTQDYKRRPSLGMQHFSSERRPQIRQGSIHGRRQSIDSQTTRERRRRPSLSSQQLSLEQFIQESEHIQEPLIDSRVYPPQLSSSSTGELKSRPTTLADAQRYTRKSTPLEHSPRSHHDRPSNLPDTSAPQRRTLLPTSQGAYDNVVIETHGFPPRCPPSPPATPDSSKNFSLQAEEPQRTRPPPPIPQRSARRSPPRQPSVLGSTNSSVVYLPSEPLRPQASSAIDPPTNSVKPSALRSPKFSISTRRSSINATMSSQSGSFSNFHETTTSPPRVSFNVPRDRDYFEDADFESLPSEIDFNVLPYENPNASPAIFRATQLGLGNPVSPRYEAPTAGPASFRAAQVGPDKPVSHDGPASSRASSFDSAAPPPISLNRRISYAIAESYQSRTAKKESKRSLLSFLRSTPAPKAVLYSEATQGKPPVPVSFSRTTVSIPLLFPGYRGQFSPPRKKQDKDLRPGSEPSVRPGSDAKTRTPRSIAHIDAAEKRKSWLKGDDVDKSREVGRVVEQKMELERILSNL